MKSKLSVLLASAVLTLSLASTAALAINNGDGVNNDRHDAKHTGNHQHKSKRGMKGDFKRMAKYLALTDEQREQAKAINKTAKTSGLVLKESMQGFHQQRKVLLMEEHFNEQAFVDLQSQYQDIIAQKALIKAKKEHSFMMILTEAQKEKMQSHQKHDGRRKHLAE
ncbi:MULTISPECIES: Spy/CpxP family protein refolding chaperone [unclassified Colwellia]|uniref:Spy/CpxP family protein refolding chaperone n=1 Tax=unclassified Colwellia TaxID=196834 RepID=UPI0015F54C58|nr:MULTISPECIES: Spy/CpxP family protein refolding chaperone [unclassified Colwellia]MBA6377965.1 Spy/CpxP family protein refolding chaperone [Colwellia sp. BRX10-7]MBA6387002.1 Spy/CpxP family protein refolding chaperone [Colwellia sp. BRX10-2]MBA6402149.1 Spy/CpxP family protein refolding chaperone [Colwellia sp. BRX10-5]MBA6404817.1 Spy/CpxP family protein refolding chaperone [Colwellia sp. BRX10-1]